MANLRGELFWTDRWFSSSAAFLPLEARGLYREMLTRAWSLGGSLPGDIFVVQKMVSASDEEWSRSWPLVKPYWRTEGERLVNDTQVEIYAETRRRVEAESQAGRKAAEVRWQKRSDMRSQCKQDLYLDQDPEKEQEPSRKKRRGPSGGPGAAGVPEPSSLPAEPSHRPLLTALPDEAVAKLQPQQLVWEIYRELYVAESDREPTPTKQAFVQLSRLLKTHPVRTFIQALEVYFRRPPFACREGARDIGRFVKFFDQLADNRTLDGTDASVERVLARDLRFGEAVHRLQQRFAPTGDNGHADQALFP